MILPDVSDSSLSLNSDKNISKRSFRQSLDLGLGLSLPLQKSDELVSRMNTQKPASYLRKDCLVGNARNGMVEAKEPNILLGIIRELVEETKEWDNSLFMNQDFKSMIEGSKVFALDNTFLPSPSCQGQDRIKHNRQYNPQGDADKYNHESNPADVPRRDGFDKLPGLTRSEPCSPETPVLSYWEDENTKE